MKVEQTLDQNLNVYFELDEERTILSQEGFLILEKSRKRQGWVISKEGVCKKPGGQV